MVTGNRGLTRIINVSIDMSRRGGNVHIIIPLKGHNTVYTVLPLKANCDNRRRNFSK